MSARHAAGASLLAALSLSSAAARADVQACIANNNLAAEEQAQHRLLAAREKYLACASAGDCPAMVRDECQQSLDGLRKLIPSLVIAVVDARGHDVAEAALSLDGVPVARDGAALEVDPGRHALVAVWEGRRVELSVVANEGEPNRRVELRFPAAEAAAPALPAAPPAGRSRLPSYVLGGAGALAAGSFAVFALRGHSGMSDLSRCKPYCATADVERVRRDYLVADVSLGVSLLALGFATYWWLRPEPRPETGTALRLDVAAAPSGAALGLSWRR